MCLFKRKSLISFLPDQTQTLNRKHDWLSLPRPPSWTRGGDWLKSWSSSFSPRRQSQKILILIDGKWSLFTVLVYIDFCVLGTSKVHYNTFLAASQTIQDSNTSIILLYCTENMLTHTLCLIPLYVKLCFETLDFI